MRKRWSTSSTLAQTCRRPPTWHGSIMTRSITKWISSPSSYNLVGGPLAAMGHNVVSANGGAVGGFQAIMFVADPNAPQATGGPGNAVQWPCIGAQPEVPPAAHQGVLPCGSDHRKDGAAVGY